MKCIRINMKCICIMNILNDINTLLRPSKNNTNTIELTVHTSCYWGLRLLCFKGIVGVSEICLRFKQGF